MAGRGPRQSGDHRTVSPVRAENPVHGSDQQSCCPSRPTVMITDHVPAVHVLPDTRAASWLRLSRREETWKTAEILTAPPAHGPAAPAGAPPEPDLGGPGTARGPGRRNTESPPPRTAAAGHPGHDRALAPRHRRPPLGRPIHARRIGRPATRPNIRVLVLQAGPRNPEWGYRSIHGNWPGLGLRVSASTVWKILNKAAIDPRRGGPGQPGCSSCPPRLTRSWRGLLTAELFDGTQAHVLAVHSAPNLWGSITGSPLAGSGPRSGA